MGFRLSAIARPHRLLGRSLSADVPKGYLAVYVRDNQKKRFVILVSYLNQPGFQDLISQAEEDFGYNHLMRGLTIPCKQGLFLEVVSNCLNGS